MHPGMGWDGRARPGVACSTFVGSTYFAFEKQVPRMLLLVAIPFCSALQTLATRRDVLLPASSAVLCRAVWGSTLCCLFAHTTPHATPLACLALFVRAGSASQPCGWRFQTAVAGSSGHMEHQLVTTRCLPVAASAISMQCNVMQCNAMQCNAMP